MYYHELTGKDWEHTKGQTQAFGHGLFFEPDLLLELLLCNLYEP